MIVVSIWWQVLSEDIIRVKRLGFTWTFLSKGLEKRKWFDFNGTKIECNLFRPIYVLQLLQLIHVFGESFSHFHFHNVLGPRRTSGSYGVQIVLITVYGVDFGRYCRLAIQPITIRDEMRDVCVCISKCINSHKMKSNLFSRAIPLRGGYEAASKRAT